uniref:RPGR-interacting protein 1 first C2 domain-containing protein n=1 Tax=Plectus sambesii TaxID=2011161 RepID=A0A914UVK1_9BILA
MPPQSTNRPHVERWNRAELEDHYFRLYDDHDELKRQYNIQQDKMKKMASKVLATMSGKSKKDIEDEDAINKIADLERQVFFLQNKLQSAVHQLSVYAHSPLPPGHRSTAASTARSHRRIDHRASPDRRSISSQAAQRPTDREHKIVHVVSSSTVDHRRLESNLMEMRHQTDTYEAEITSLRDKLEAREAEMDEERARLKSQLTSDQRAAIQENIEVIRLQRQLKEKSTELAQAQARFSAIEKDMRTIKRQHDSLLTEYDQVNTRLRTEQNRNAQLSSEVQSSRTNTGGAMFEITQEMDSLKHENAVLKETNEKLIASAFDASKDVQWAQNDRAMRAKIVELETAVKADVNTRNEIFEKLGQEIASREQAEDHFRKTEVQMLQLKAENERLERKMNSLSDGMTWLDVEQAIASYKQQTDRSTIMSSANSRPDFLLSLDKEASTARDELDRLRLMLAESVEELEKTRNMLIVQHRINADFQAEVSTLNQRTDTYKREYETKLKEYAQMLDQRAARIQRLENQLRDIAYGRRPVKIVSEDMDEPTDTESQLEAGQSLLEIKLTKLTLTDLGLKWMSSTQPTIFLTIEFFDFEIQFTPMIQGPE